VEIDEEGPEKKMKELLRGYWDCVKTICGRRLTKNGKAKQDDPLALRTPRMKGERERVSPRGG